MIIINSRSNKLIKWVKKLNSHSKELKNENLIIIETKKILLTLIEDKCDIEYIFLTKHFLQKNNQLINKINCKNIILIDDQLMSYISNLKTPDGILAIIKNNFTNRQVNNQNSIALYNIQNPNNLGAIIRSAISFNFKNIYLIGTSCFIYHHDVIRSSMGYVFKINCLFFKNWNLFVKHIRRNNIIDVIAFDNATDSINVRDFSSKNHICLLFGSEGEGLPNSILEQCDKIVKIDIKNNVESLNVAIAASIAMYQLNK